MELKEFQRKAIEGDQEASQFSEPLKHSGLIKAIDSALKGSKKESFAFEAPTGSGKTVIMAHLIRAIKEPCAILWLSIADGGLHQQSKRSIESHLSGSERHCVLLDGSESVELDSNGVYFLSMNALKQDTSYIRQDSERGKSLFTLLSDFRATGKKILLIIDESHKGAETEQGADLISNIDPDVKIEISATLLNKSQKKGALLTVSHHDAISAGLLRPEIWVNRFQSVSSGGNPIEKKDPAYLIDLAVRQQKEIIQQMQATPNIIKQIPLILIQMDNDSKSKIGADGREALDFIVESAKSALEKHYPPIDGEPTEPRKNWIGVWLSSEKSNIDNIPSGNQRILIFKQAIAVGWDCPRAQILVKLRELSRSETFDVQLLGRILRTYQQRHFGSKLIDNAFIFTNASKINAEYRELIIEQPVETTIKISDRLDLPSSYALTRSDPLNTKQISNLKKAIKENVAIKGIAGAAITGTSGKSQVAFGTMHISTGFVSATKSIESHNADSSYQELHDETLEIVKGTLRSRYSQATYSAILKSIYEVLVETLIGSKQSKSISPELRTNLFSEILKNRDLFVSSINKSLNNCGIVIEDKRDEGNFTFNLPAAEYFSAESHTEVSMTKYAYNRYFRSNNASSVEIEFERFIDSVDGVEWWYKNGTKIKESFSILRNENGMIFNFFPDYLIKLKSGKILVLDTKSGRTLTEAVSSGRLKALSGYVGQSSIPGQPSSLYPVFGRIVAQHSGKGGFVVNPDQWTSAHNATDKILGTFIDFSSWMGSLI